MATARDNFASSTALIVEDSDLMRELLRNVISSFEFKKVLTVETADAALQILDVNLPDVIVTDWLLGGPSGLDLLKNIRREYPDPERRVPIVMCTAYTDPKRIFRARDAGVNEILAKPFTATRIYSALASCLFTPRHFIDKSSYVGPDRRRRQLPIDFPDRRGRKGGAVVVKEEDTIEL